MTQSSNNSNPLFIENFSYNHKGATSIDEIPGLFSSMPNLSKLSLGYNQLSNLKNIPTNLPKLTHLYLDHNNLASLGEYLLPYSQLECLDLDSNNVQDFSTLPSSLKILDVSNNQLTSFEISPENLPNLTYFHANYNKLAEIKDLTLDFSKITDLSLAHNRLRNLQRTPALPPMPQLKNLDISHNRMHNLQGLPADLPSLTRLWISDNQLTSLEGLPANLPALDYQQFSVAGNPLRTLSYLSPRMLAIVIRELPRLWDMNRVQLFQQAEKAKLRPKLTSAQWCDLEADLYFEPTKYHALGFTFHSPNPIYLHTHAEVLITKLSAKNPFLIPDPDQLNHPEFQELVAMYRRTPPELAYSYSQDPTTLTKIEIERLEHEGEYREREILETNAVDPADPILTAIRVRIQQRVGETTRILL
jgi:Leucine-rich repeat (LRR) protein